MDKGGPEPLEFGSGLLYSILITRNLRNDVVNHVGFYVLRHGVRSLCKQASSPKADRQPKVLHEEHESLLQKAATQTQTLSPESPKSSGLIWEFPKVGDPDMVP